jgi:hypothetical protein
MQPINIFFEAYKKIIGSESNKKTKSSSICDIRTKKMKPIFTIQTRKIKYFY